MKEEAMKHCCSSTFLWFLIPIINIFCNVTIFTIKKNSCGPVKTFTCGMCCSPTSTIAPLGPLITSTLTWRSSSDLEPVGGQRQCQAAAQSVPVPRTTASPSPLLLGLCIQCPPCTGPAASSCLCSLCTTRGRGRAPMISWFFILAQRPRCSLTDLSKSRPNGDTSKGVNGGWEDMQRPLSLVGVEIKCQLAHALGI